MYLLTWTLATLLLGIVPLSQTSNLECNEIRSRRICLESKDEKGCIWLFGAKAQGEVPCVTEDQVECADLDKKSNCLQLFNCRWQGKQCIDRPVPGMCPAPRPDKICSDKFKPVRCGDCQYDNRCKARAAGFIARKECVKICSSDRNCRTGAGEICYNGFNDESCDVDCPSSEANSCEGLCVTSSGSTCGGLLGARCPFGETCVDKKGDDCSPTCGGADCAGICIDAMCPKPRFPFCQEMLQPVVCGKNCRYDNLCTAQSAGYTEEECIGIDDDKCPAPIHELCEDIEQPVICGDNCPYKNPCLAGTVGFDNEQCKPDFCKHVECPNVQCDDGFILEMKQGDCCPSCVQDCDTVFCPIIDCKPGFIPVPDPEGCCEICARERCYTPDCTDLPCPIPQCTPSQTLFTPRDECCAKCVPLAYCFDPCPEEPICEEDEELVKTPDECCPKCEKKCMEDPCFRRPACNTVACTDPECEPGELIFREPGECCRTCVKPPDLCDFECDEPVCEEDETLFQRPDKCCRTCEKICLVI